MRTQKKGAPGDRSPRWIGASFDKTALSLVLTASLALRVTIAIRGGQYFWTDESRYALSQQAVADFLDGHFRVGMDALFSNAGHMLFEVIGVVPAFMQRAAGDCVFLPAIFFGSFSVGIIYLVSRLVRAQGGSSREALFAALLVAGCNSFFYYARHVFPYDLALCLFLGAALCGFRLGRVNSLLAGLLSGLGFLTYNGYWLFGGTVLVLTVLSHRESLAKSVVRGFTSLLGLFLPIAAVLGIGRLLGHNLVRSFMNFSHWVSVDTGDRGIAWRVIPEYLWVSEHYLSLLLGLALVASVAACLTKRGDARIALWLTGGAIFYLGQVAVYDVFKIFFVSARYVRPLAIFLCLMGGWLLAKLSNLGTIGRSATGLVLIAVIIQSAVNFSVPLGQVFPAEFEKRAATIIRSNVEREPGLYRVLSDGYYESAQDTAVRGLPCVVLYERPHPLQFLPYTFDDYTNALRKAFRSRDASMRAVRVYPERPDGRTQISRHGGMWAPYIGAMRLEVIFDPSHLNESQPIVSSGQKGAGDEVFVAFIDQSTVRMGFDHWAYGGPISQPIHCDLSRPHVLIISYGSLYPDASSLIFEENAGWRALKHFVFVKFDAEPAIAREMDCYPALPESIATFQNSIGFSTASRDFTGRLISASPVSPNDILREIERLPPMGPALPTR